MKRKTRMPQLTGQRTVSETAHRSRRMRSEGELPLDPRRDRVARIVEGLQKSIRHRDALKLGGMTWREFQSALPHYPDLAEIYGPIDAANTQNACMGFSYVCRFIGSKYRDILPQIANPHQIVDRHLLAKALEVAGLLRGWIEQVEQIARESGHEL